MTITLTIDPGVESIAAQTIAKALNLNSVTDEQVRVALANRFRNDVANLYVQGDRLVRQQQLESAAVSNAAAYITAV